MCVLVLLHSDEEVCALEFSCVHLHTHILDWSNLPVTPIVMLLV